MLVCARAVLPFGLSDIKRTIPGAALTRAERDVHLGRVRDVARGEDGLSVAREFRITPNVAIIMITGKGDPIDRVVGLELGADDYIPKPFELREVLARRKP